MRAVLLSAVLMVSAVVARAEEPASPPDVTLHKQGHGWVLTDTKGMTLYSTRQDQKGKPSCEGACAKNWPPLIAPDDAKAFGAWSVSVRADGSKQWAYEGKPLYRYAYDQAPGDLNGDEQQQQWSVALKPLPTPPGFSSLRSPLGYLLVDRQRMTLYTSDADTASKSVCESACARDWKPAEVWWLAAVDVPDWSVIQRADGNRQWAYRGKPVYRYAGDVNPGDALGDKMKGWHAVVLEAASGVPSWTTVQRSDGGELYADPKGMTLYAYDLNRPRQFGIGIVRDMETPEFWKPVLAKETDKSVGFFTIVAKDDGTRQWAYKGNPIYINTNDHEPGDINGVRSNDRLWKPIMTSGQSMPGSGN